jgi:hypothetical protein
MRRLILTNHLSDDELKQYLKENKNSLSFPKWQTLYLIQIDKVDKASLISPLVNLSVHTIYKVVEGYNLKGKLFINTKPRGGRRRSLLSHEDEVKLLDRFKHKAMMGKVKSGNDIKSEVEKLVNKEVSDD